MMDFLRGALSEDNGMGSASRIAMWALVGCSILGYLFALVVAAHSYFALHIVIPSGTLLDYLVGGSTGSALGGGMIYLSNQIGNKNIPQVEPNPEEEEET